uniref:Solute carrier organic anion transporter family member 5A1-like n=1 Tax=Diabrotica virgifera virgifera TaxID=50390 RepID=A0A6P7GRQ0_DIAVI
MTFIELLREAANKIKCANVMVNIFKDKAPLLGFTYFIRMLGPALGYALASLCLKIYVNPNVTPTIDNQDPRWLGAWWLGWIILAIVIFFLSTLLALFPKTLPRAAVRKELLKRQMSRQPSKASSMKAEEDSDLPRSFKGKCGLINCRLDPISECNSACQCEHIKYNPVCSENGVTYISACHAGCRDVINVNGSSVFSDCSCIRTDETHSYKEMTKIEETTQFEKALDDISKNSGFASPGSCQVDCLYQFYIFLAVVCLLKFSGATGRASNFLVTVRCVEEKDKAVAMGFGLMLMSLCAFVPSPILFGFILDKACLVWGRTCSGTGNCWLYNGADLRSTMNFTAATFVFIGALFDIGVWYFVKDVEIFEEDVELEDVIEFK